MTKEELMDFIDKNIVDGAEVDMIISTINDNYDTYGEMPMINEYDGKYEFILYLPDIFEVDKG